MNYRNQRHFPSHHYFHHYFPPRNHANRQVLAPAYTPITVREGFGQARQTQSQYPNGVTANPSQPPVATTPGREQKINWPEAVRDYVRRSFEDTNKDPSVSRAEVEAKLKQVIQYTQDNDIMYTTDWAKMELPQQMVRNERQQKLMAEATAVDYSNKTLLAGMANVGLSPQSVAQPTAVYPGTNSKKRKSSDLSGPDQVNGAAVPWRSAKATAPSLGARITMPTNDKRPSMDSPLPAKSKFQKNAEKRQRRGDGGYQSSYRSPTPPPTSGPIVGYSTNLEKSYFRLTSAPKPSEVRPEHILHQTLDLLKKKWRKENNYNYICEQFKSLRQDLTVQRIRNEFTVSVYEIHARIALEKGDLGEYNQCQTQLRALYASGVKGNSIEFKAYRILYFLYTANRTALNDAIADLTTAEKEERPIKHALNVRSSLALGNYHKFFQLYLDVPNMGAYLMDMFIKRERLAALAVMCKSYVTSSSLSIQDSYSNSPLVSGRT